MDHDALVAAGRAIWGERRADPAEAALVLGVVAGDVARAGRAWTEQGFLTGAQRDDLARELGNIQLTVARLMDDLLMDPDVCLAAAIRAQRDYARRREEESCSLLPMMAD